MRLNFLHLNALWDTISNGADRDGIALFLSLSTYPQNSQRERKKEAKKERERATTIFP